MYDLLSKEEIGNKAMVMVPRELADLGLFSMACVIDLLATGCV